MMTTTKMRRTTKRRKTTRGEGRRLVGQSVTDGLIDGCRRGTRTRRRRTRRTRGCVGSRSNEEEENGTALPSRNEDQT